MKLFALQSFINVLMEESRSKYTKAKYKSFILATVKNVVLKIEVVHEISAVTA